MESEYTTGPLVDIVIVREMGDLAGDLECKADKAAAPILQNAGVYREN